MTGAGQKGGTFRLKAGGVAVEQLTQAPLHVNALYATGGVLIAAQAWQQRQDPDLSSIVSLSTDGGTTWYPVPVPPA